jgi:hypothetical protein
MKTEKFFSGNFKGKKGHLNNRKEDNTGRHCREIRV